MSALTIATYFAIGFIAFLSFWRWGSDEAPGETADTFISIMFLFGWPIMGLIYVLAYGYVFLVFIARKVKKG